MRQVLWVLGLAVTLGGGFCRAQELPGWAKPLLGERTALEAAQQVFQCGRLDGEDFLLESDQRLPILSLPDAPASLAAGSRFSSPQIVPIRSQGRSYVALLWSGSGPQGTSGGFGAEVAVLAIFQPELRAPTDVTEVQQDLHTTLHLVPLGDEDAIEIVNWHLSAGEEYRISDLLQVWNGKLQPIASVTATNRLDCVSPHAETLHWLTQPAGGQSAKPEIIARIERLEWPTEFADALSGCEAVQPQRKRLYEDRYGWSDTAQRYLRLGGNLDQRPAQP
jgi:hypothetical protein